jgi:peptidyl-prolyl cis-trans isomerase A (cyclophilin A)
MTRMTFCVAASLAVTSLAVVGCKEEAKQAPAVAAPQVVEKKVAPVEAANPAPAAAPAAGAAKLSDVASVASAKETAPAQFKVKMVTTKGEFTITVHRDWAPLGADRFYNLVKLGYFNDLAFFRVVKGFMVQFGIHGDPAVNTVWREARITDDPAGVKSNGRGFVTFATGGPNTRTTQLFINYVDNARLDGMGFAPIGQVTEGMDVVDALEGVYGEGAPMGAGPAQGRIQGEGNAYLKAQFPKLDYIKSASL